MSEWIIWCNGPIGRLLKFFSAAAASAGHFELGYNVLFQKIFITFLPSLHGRFFSLKPQPSWNFLVLPLGGCLGIVWNPTPYGNVPWSFKSALSLSSGPHHPSWSQFPYQEAARNDLLLCQSWTRSPFPPFLPQYFLLFPYHLLVPTCIYTPGWSPTCYSLARHGHVSLMFIPFTTRSWNLQVFWVCFKNAGQA